MRERPSDVRRELALAALVALLTVKALWGFWERDLTFGDTSSYFKSAVRWHYAGEVNIVWSPLYTAYFGAWFNVTKDAAALTLLHRVGLVVLSTALVAWLGLLTLPRVLALLLVAWWIALPIHYDTLYEVHLFGALPVLAMAVVVFAVPPAWRGPVLGGIAVVASVLVRNEYVLVAGVLAAAGVWQLVRDEAPTRSVRAMGSAVARVGMVLLGAALLIVFFYSVSHVRGARVLNAAESKHALNMCQVYAFGYQQRNPTWPHSPWTECQGLMHAQFGKPLPTLGEMVRANPREVATHFLWNLGLTRAGAEVLLFNATSSRENPDYAPVRMLPVIPTVLLCLTLAIMSAGLLVLSRGRGEREAETRRRLAVMTPLLLGVLVMSVAVVLTQRPRPSYFLGTAVLYVWLVLQCGMVMVPRSRGLDTPRACLVTALILLVVVPSYRSLPLPSKLGSLTRLYEALRPEAPRLCRSGSRLAIGEYASELSSYLCKPPNVEAPDLGLEVLSIGSLSGEELHNPGAFVAVLESRGIDAVVVDRVMLQRYPGLEGCRAVRDAFLARDWEQLAYAVAGDRDCTAAYARPAR
jgi:hypothetical protein